MHLPEEFAYPMEKASIIDTHLVFGTWVQSGGFSYMDWYKDNSGYRNTSKVYSAGN
jgi:LruC domain-containing protein